MVPGVKKKNRRRTKSPKFSILHNHKEDLESTQRFLHSDSSNSDNEDVRYAGQRRTGCRSIERELGILLGVAIVIILSMTAVIVIQAINTPKFKMSCNTPECVEVAGSMLRNMNLSTDPCDDFYEYACGNWVKHHIPPPNHARFDIFADLYQRNLAQLYQALSESGSMYKGQNSSAISKAKMFFNSCMDQEAAETRGATPLLKLIKEVGSWTVTSDPVSGTWNEASWDFMPVVILAHQRGLSVLFSMKVAVDDRNSSSHIIAFQQNGITLGDRDEYVGNKTEKYHTAFVKYFVRVAHLLGAQDANKSTALAEEIWQFEKQLAEAFLPSQQLRDVSALYNKVKISNVSEMMGDSFDVKRLVNEVIGYEIPEDEDVLVYMPEYLRKMGNIVKQTEKRILANYLVWHVVNSMVPYLTSRFQDSVLILHAATTGVRSRSPTWERCTGLTNNVFSFTTGALYSENHFTSEDRKLALAILDGIQNTIINHFPNVAWMDETTATKAADKARAIVHMIGYPDFIEHTDKLDDYYKMLQVTQDNMFTNVLNVRKEALRRNIDKLNKTVDRSEWQMGPAEVNAYYSPDANNIVFPAAILQTPFFDPKAPMSLNYGAMGMVMGHELTHAFDSTGRSYDKIGDLHNWWTNKSVDAFNERSKCMVNQYNQYKVQNRHLNGNLTLNENIADNGGLKIGYKAYKKWAHEVKATDTLLPGLNMTVDQQFFLSFAQLWCSYYRPAYAISSLMTDVHSNSRYRVIGTLSNMDTFADAFKCSKGSKMNPEKKCVVW